MNRLEFTRIGIRIGKEEKAFILGEVHFYRLNPSQWGKVLDRVKELGVEFVATYVNWDKHEIKPGEYDFSGETAPECDLCGFLGLLKKKKLYCWIRPGPYNYSEWNNAGIPDHAAHFHRRDPEFMAKAAPYLDAVCEAIRPHLFDSGGSVIAVQPDNEINTWYSWFWRELGLDGGGYFGEFLRKRYGKISSLNRAWGTAYKKISDARGFAPQAMLGAQGKMRARVLDFQRFLHAESKTLTEIWTSEIRKRLPGLPVIHNSLAGFEHHDWKDLLAHGDLVGFDVYPDRLFRPSVTEGEFAEVFASGRGGYPYLLDLARFQDELACLPFVAELQSGLPAGRVKGEYPPNHYRLMHVGLLGSGIKAWNWFMLANRDNWYGSPINERGEQATGIFAEFKKAAAILSGSGIRHAERICPVGAGTSSLCEALGDSAVGGDVRRALFASSTDYRLLDLDYCQRPPEILFYAGADWLPRDTAKKILTWVAGGMNLVFFGEGVRLDESLRECNLFGLPEISSACGFSGSPRFKLNNIGFVGVSPVCTYSATPGWSLADAEITPQDFPTPMPLLQNTCVKKLHPALAAVKKLGRGKIVILGCKPAPTVILAAIRACGISRPAEVEPAGVQIQVLSGKGKDFLSVSHAGNHGIIARIKLNGRLSKRKKWNDLFGGARISGGKELLIPLSSVSGTILRGE